MDFKGERTEKFLGKQLEFERLIFEYLTAIKNTSSTGDDFKFINVVNRLYSTITPYADNEDFEKEIDKIEERFDQERKESIGKFGDDEDKLFQAYRNRAEAIYLALCKLLKKIKMFPQEAENGDL